MKTSSLPLMLLVASAAAGCDHKPAARSAEAAPVHVDSVVPREEALRRFQAGLEKPSAFSGGSTSRDALVRAVIHGIETRDTAALAGLTLTRSEFAFLYYPTNPQSLPPYDLAPGLMWFMLSENNAKGLRRVIEERGGRRLGYLNHDCLGKPSKEGANTVWGPCLVRRLQAPGDTVSERLFGPIIERDGRFKLVSFANRL